MVVHHVDILPDFAPEVRAEHCIESHKNLVTFEDQTELDDSAREWLTDTFKDIGFPVFVVLARADVEQMEVRPVSPMLCTGEDSMVWDLRDLGDILYARS